MKLHYVKRKELACAARYELHLYFCILTILPSLFLLSIAPSVTVDHTLNWAIATAS